MVLTDDNFATIVGAVEEGRRIYNNIRKAIQFLLASNLSEVLGIFVATLLGVTLLEPVHLLWINLVTDCFPALALGMEKAEPDVMKRKPRNAKAGVFADGMGGDVIYQGLLVAVLTLVSYFLGHAFELGGWSWKFETSSYGMTMAFLTLSFAEIFHSFNMRSQKKSLFQLDEGNKMLTWAALGSAALTLIVVLVPFVSTKLFEFAYLDWWHYLVAIAVAFLVIPVVEIVKLIERKNDKKKGK
jgi:Ca2+-transporting ATPase